MRITTIGVALIAVAAAACRRGERSPSGSADTASVRQSATPVPQVPRFPAGLPDLKIAPWSGLSAACNGSTVRDIRPCMQSFVDAGHVHGLVTLVDDPAVGTQLDAVGRYRPHTLFQIMSMTKPVTSVAIMRLVEAGKISSVDTRVVALPGLGDFPYPEITVKQLLTHTSGIWYWREPQPGVRTGIAPHLTNRFDKAPDVTTRDKSLDFVARHYANPTLYPLGSTDPEYSNIGYTMLGWIVERVSGQPFDRFVRQEILAPLGMTDTFFFPDSASPDQRDRIASLDRRLPDPAEYAHYDERRPGWVYPSPEGGLYSTATDLRQFLLLFRHRGQIPGHSRVLSERSIDLLLRDQLPAQDFAPVVGVRCAGNVGRSLGFFVVRKQGCADLPGFGPGTVEHDGRFATDFWYDPSHDRIAVFLYQIVKNGESTPSVAENDMFKQLLARLEPR